MQGFNREVILGVGGGIAAYKSCDLLRRLQDHGFSVTVVPTPSSLNFVGKASWEALSGRAVTTDVFENVEEVRHISLAKRADFIIIAPATADLIARIAAGRADDLLTNVVLAADVPILVVPAMHPQMWNDPATLTNVETLRIRGLVVLEPEVGPLTSGDVGQGRFPETATILAALQEITQSNFDLLGKKVLVTAGGTREPIDSVRFIGNQSSGKQGYAVARTALRRGASVTLIAANTTLEEIEGVKTLRVETAQEMLEILTDEFPRCDILVMAAAVADAKPESVKHGKIKKADFSSINLVKNPDLLQTVTARKSQQVVIAFAAESTHDSSSAEAKLLSKGADILYLNDISHGDIFNSETTYGEIFINGGPSVKVAKTTKDTLANQLLDQAILKLS